MVKVVVMLVVMGVMIVVVMKVRGDAFGDELIW